MDRTWLVFIAGTITSLLPVYWLLSRADRRARARRDRRRPCRRRSASPADRQASSEFVALLRSEAARRLDRTLAEAVSEIERPAGAGSSVVWLDASRRRRIEEAQTMLEPLFGVDVSERCAAHMRAFMAATADAPDVARAARIEIRALLAGASRDHAFQSPLQSSLVAA